MSNPAERAATLLFASQFSRDPDALAWAPGRVNLIGEHTDYNGGFVLPMPLTLGTSAAAALSTDGRLVAVSANASNPHPFETPLDAISPGAITGWPAYIAGVVALVSRAAGRSLPGLRLAVAGDLPIGAGLSSSAALEIAIARVITSLLCWQAEPLQLAELAREAEHRFAGVPCGIMDQHVVSAGRPGSALLIDCESAAHRHVPVAPGIAFIVADSGIRHELASSAYAQRRAECVSALAQVAAAVGPRSNLRRCSMTDLEAARLDPTAHRRARHVITECARTLEAAACLEHGRWPPLGHLMTASHTSLRDDFEVSHPEVDRLIDTILHMPGVHGARMTGGGFGGCIVAAVDPDRCDDVLRSLHASNRSCFVAWKG